MLRQLIERSRSFEYPVDRYAGSKLLSGAEWRWYKCVILCSIGSFVLSYSSPVTP